MKVLGFKVAVFPHVRRPIPRVAREHPDMGRFALRLDTFGIDSDHDYDPVWAKCAELGRGREFHALRAELGSRRSPTRYGYNHMGAFSAAGDSLW